MNLHGDVDAYLEFAEVVAEVGGAEGHEHEGERRGRAPAANADRSSDGRKVRQRGARTGGSRHLCVGRGSNLRRHFDFCVFDASTTCRHLVANKGIRRLSFVARILHRTTTTGSTTYSSVEPDRTA